MTRSGGANSTATTGTIASTLALTAASAAVEGIARPCRSGGDEDERAVRTQYRQRRLRDGSIGQQLAFHALP